eukprot:11211734-Lingulodinium_polyedra.AAC.1
MLKRPWPTASSTPPAPPTRTRGLPRPWSRAALGWDPAQSGAGAGRLAALRPPLAAPAARTWPSSTTSATTSSLGRLPPPARLPLGRAQVAQKRRADRRSRLDAKATEPGGPRAVPLVSRCPGQLGRCEAASVGPATRAVYDKMLARFLAWAKHERLHLRSADEYDRALVDYVDH